MDHLHWVFLLQSLGHTCVHRELHSSMKTPWDHLTRELRSTQQTSASMIRDSQHLRFTHPHGHEGKLAMLKVCDVAKGSETPSKCSRRPVWGRLIPERVPNDGWAGTGFMINHITGLDSPHQGHHRYILKHDEKLKLEKAAMKHNYFCPTWLS